MAKDKGKKKDESKKKDKGAKPDMSGDFAKPSEAPATGDGFRFEHEDNLGKLFLIHPLREEDFVSDEYGPGKRIIANVVEIDEKKPEKSVEHSDVWIRGGWTRGALRGFIDEGRLVLGRLDQSAEKSKSKKNPAWVLEDATKGDIEIAREYLASVDPFKAGGGDEGKKKGKK